MHVPVDALWKFHNELVNLSEEQAEHVFRCKACLHALGLCTAGASLEEVLEYTEYSRQEKRLAASGA